MNRNAAALLWKVLDSLLFSVTLLVGVKLTDAFSSFEIVFLVNLAATLLAFVIFSLVGRNTIWPRHPKLHFYRGALGVISTGCFLLSMKHLGLAESTAIGFLAPIVTTLISKYRLKETIDITTGVSLTMNFFSVVLVLCGRFEWKMKDGTMSAIGFSIASMICMVFYNLNLKNIGREDTVEAQSIFGPFFSALILMPFFAPRISSIINNLSMQHAILIALYSAILVLKSLAKYFSFRFGAISNLMPMEYAQIAFTAALGAMFLGQKIVPLAALGVATIFLTGVAQLFIASKTTTYYRSKT